MTMAAPIMPSSGDSYVWGWVDASYMRNLAQRCSQAARDCPHLPTSHELEAIGIELMEKAAELDELNQVGGTDAASSKSGFKAKRGKKSPR